MLAQLPVDDPFSFPLTYAKTCLIEARQHPALLAEKQDHYLSGFVEKIDSFKEYVHKRATLKFISMKDNLLQCLKKHDNTLIVWALGNDGECIDQDPFWHGVLDVPTIPDHTLLVQGNQPSGRKSVESNFTAVFKDHCVGKPYRCQVWSSRESRYVQGSGTSFSAPLTTMDAYIKAKELFEKTGEMPRYDVIKQILLRG